MDRTNLATSYAKSLLWVAAFTALIVAVNLITQLTFVDFVHGNPNRTKTNAIFMIILYPLIMGTVSVVGVFLVFGLPQFIQGLTTYILTSRFGRYSYLFVGLMLPLTSIVTWFCFDYLTPSDFNLSISEGLDWTPYQHGITLQRYLMILAAQASVTAFSILYCDASIRIYPRRRVVLGTLVIIIVVGTIWGHHGAVAQYQFIDHPGSGPRD